MARARAFPNETAEQILDFARNATFTVEAVSPLTPVTAVNTDLIRGVMYCVAVNGFSSPGDVSL